MSEKLQKPVSLVLAGKFGEREIGFDGCDLATVSYHTFFQGGKDALMDMGKWHLHRFARSGTGGQCVDQWIQISSFCSSDRSNSSLLQMCYFFSIVALSNMFSARLRRNNSIRRNLAMINDLKRSERSMRVSGDPQMSTTLILVSFQLPSIDELEEDQSSQRVRLFT
jgi:hypothetical protein